MYNDWSVLFTDSKRGVCPRLGLPPRWRKPQSSSCPRDLSLPAGTRPRVRMDIARGPNALFEGALSGTVRGASRMAPAQPQVQVTGKGAISPAFHPRPPKTSAPGPIPHRIAASTRWRLRRQSPPPRSCPCGAESSGSPGGGGGRGRLRAASPSPSTPALDPRTRGFPRRVPVPAAAQRLPALEVTRDLSGPRVLGHQPRPRAQPRPLRGPAPRRLPPGPGTARVATRSSPLRRRTRPRVASGPRRGLQAREGCRRELRPSCHTPSTRGPLRPPAGEDD